LGCGYIWACQWCQVWITDDSRVDHATVKETQCPEVVLQSMTDENSVWADESTDGLARLREVHDCAVQVGLGDAREPSVHVTSG
jgi:hypothetical protein